MISVQLPCPACAVVWCDVVAGDVVAVQAAPIDGVPFIEQTGTGDVTARRVTWKGVWVRGAVERVQPC